MMANRPLVPTTAADTARVGSGWPPDEHAGRTGEREEPEVEGHHHGEQPARGGRRPASATPTPPAVPRARWPPGRPSTDAPPRPGSGWPRSRRGPTPGRPARPARWPARPRGPASGATTSRARRPRPATRPRHSPDKHSSSQKPNRTASREVDDPEAPAVQAHPVVEGDLREEMPEGGVVAEGQEQPQHDQDDPGTPIPGPGVRAPPDRSDQEHHQGDQREQPDVASDLGQVVAVGEGRLVEDGVPAEQVLDQQQDRPRGAERSRPEERVVLGGPLGGHDERAPREQLGTPR